MFKLTKVVFNDDGCEATTSNHMDLKETYEHALMNIDYLYCMGDGTTYNPEKSRFDNVEDGYIRKWGAYGTKPITFHEKEYQDITNLETWMMKILELSDIGNTNIPVLSYISQEEVETRIVSQPKVVIFTFYCYPGNMKSCMAFVEKVQV